MLSAVAMSSLPMSTAPVEVLVFPDAFRVWDESAPVYDVLDQSEGMPDGN